jgi:hypothetical protein
VLHRYTVYIQFCDTIATSATSATKLASNRCTDSMRLHRAFFYSSLLVFFFYTTVHVSGGITCCWDFPGTSLSTSFSPLFSELIRTSRRLRLFFFYTSAPANCCEDMQFSTCNPSHYAAARPRQGSRVTEIIYTYFSPLLILSNVQE